MAARVRFLIPQVANCREGHSISPGQGFKLPIYFLKIRKSKQSTELFYPVYRWRLLNCIYLYRQKQKNISNKMAAQYP